MPLECPTILFGAERPTLFLEISWSWRALFTGLVGIGVFLSGNLVTSAQSVSNAPTAAKAPLVPTYRVHRYEITGSSVLDQAAVDRVTRGTTGEAVSVAHLRRGLFKIQEAYRELGYAKAAVTLPPQPLTNGIVKVRVSEGPSNFSTEPTAPASLAAWTVPVFDIHHFEVRGNTALAGADIDRILTPAAGLAVNLDQLQKNLDQLQTAYRERGFPDATVSLPQQLLFPDGVVTIEVREGFSQTQIAARLAAEDAPVTNAPVPERTFEVRRYEVTGNTLLPAATVDQAFTNATGPAVSLKQIQQALGGLQLAYRERGFASVSVGLPPQQLTNAVVKVRVVEGVLTEITVKGNRYFSSNNVARALPSLKTNEVLNSHIFQRELDVANQNRDRQIYPVIGPGPDPGTSELTLKVKDRFPLHGRLELNNYATPGSPDWRINGSAQYNNLWQLEHQLGLSYGFSPERYKSEGLVEEYLLNRPLVANGGIYYRLPFGSAKSVADQIQSAAGFGYDEATHQFRLPPAGSRPDLTVFGSSSSSSTGVKWAPSHLVADTPLLKIVSQDSGQDVTVNDGIGGRLSFPLALSDTRRFSFSGGVDWKRSLLNSFNSNNFFITTVVTNSSGSQTIESQVASAQPVRHNEINYLPLALGVDYFQTDKQGSFAASLGLSYNFVGDSRTHYTSASWNATNPMPASYSPRSSSLNYGKANLTLTRDQKIFQKWSLLLRLSGQAATGALISNEQFALGGLNSVRGYFEGDEYGDAGWLGSAELRTPFISASVPTGGSSYSPVWLRGSVFVDGGQSFLLDSPATSTTQRSLLGTGFGLSANINNHVDLRFALGWPWLDSANTTKGVPRAYFSVGGQF